MFLSLNDTWSVPERWKIWAMSTMSAPASRVCQGLGHPRECEVGLAIGEHLLGDDVDAAFLDREIDARRPCSNPGRRGVVPRELRLDEPLQLERHLGHLNGRRTRRGAGGRRRRTRGRSSGARG